MKAYGVKTWKNTDFNFPTVRLTAFKEGAYFMGMKIFNHLPTNLKNGIFKSALKKYLLRQSFFRRVF
jgi:hypothetical protein